MPRSSPNLTCSPRVCLLPLSHKMWLCLGANAASVPGWEMERGEASAGAAGSLNGQESCGRGTRAGPAGHRGPDLTSGAGQPRALPPASPGSPDSPMPGARHLRSSLSLLPCAAAGCRGCRAPPASPQLGAGCPPLAWGWLQRQGAGAAPPAASLRAPTS